MPGDAVQHRDAAAGEVTAGEEEGGRRRGEGLWPCGREPVSCGPRAYAVRGCGVSLRHGGAASVPRGNVPGPEVKSEGADVPGCDGRGLRVPHAGPGRRWLGCAGAAPGQLCRKDGNASGPWRGGREATSMAAGAAGSGVWSHTRLFDIVMDETVYKSNKY